MTTVDRALRADAQHNRRRILDAASEVFAERGLTATLHHVADRAGLGVGTVYRRFPDKGSLVEALFESRVEEMVTFAQGTQTRPDVGEALIELFRTMAAMLAADSGLQQVVSSGGYGSERVSATCDRLFALVADLLRRAQAEGEVRADLEAMDLSLLLLMLSDLAQRTRSARPDAWKRYLDFVTDGLRASPRRELLSVPPLTSTEVLRAEPSHRT